MPIRLTEHCNISRDKFIEEMLKRNIGCSVHFIPLHRHLVWRNTYQLTNEIFPVAEKQFLNVVSIPLFTKMTDEDQQYVITQIKEILS